MKKQRWQVLKSHSSNRRTTKSIEGDSKMESLIQTYLPNVYKMGWAGQGRLGNSHLSNPLYMTVLSFIIGGFLGLVAGLFPCLTAPGGVLENKVVFWILDKDYLYFPCGTIYHSLGSLVTLLSSNRRNKHWSKCGYHTAIFCSLCLLCPSSTGCLG